MKRIINYPPSRGQRLFLGILPFILIAVAYLLASEARLSVNPTDKLMPGVASFVAAMQRMMFEQDLHDRLLTEVLEAPVEAPGMTLFNVLAQEEAVELLRSSEEYF